MTFKYRHRTDRNASQEYARHGAMLLARRPSQRELVAWSLLRCPDHRPWRDRP